MAKQPAPSRYPEMIRCENCGEDYSSTYKRCPFCDERPGGGIHGRRIDSRAGAKRNPLQLLGLAASLVLIIVALFIVFTKISPLIFQRDNTPENTLPNTTQTQPNEQSDPDSTAHPDTPSSTDTPPDSPEVTQPQTPDTTTVSVSSITLSRSDFTLTPDEVYTLTATLSPSNAEAAVTWSSSDPSVLSVDAEGTVTNKNTTGQTVSVTVTASCGDVSADCLVRCRSKEVAGTATEQPSNTSPQTPSGSGSSGGSVTANTEAVVVNAEAGLNIRSGPGSEYEKIASASNGSTVTILEDSGNGWYKIDYGNGKVGYASSSFIKPK